MRLKSRYSFYIALKCKIYNNISMDSQDLMTLLKIKIKMKKELTSDEKGVLACYDRLVDFTGRKNIDEIINYVKK